jgi:hypothetical protein
LSDEEWAIYYQDYLYERKTDLKQLKNTIIAAILEARGDLEIED